MRYQGKITEWNEDRGYGFVVPNAGAWRTREGTLHLLAMVGGWPGAMLAQRRLRHKTRKGTFQEKFIATVIVNVLLLIGLLSPFGNFLLS